MSSLLFSHVTQCSLVISYQPNCLIVTSQKSEDKIDSNTQPQILIIFLFHVTHKFWCCQSFLWCLIRPDLTLSNVALTLHQLWSKPNLLGYSVLAPWKNQLNLTDKYRLSEKMKGSSQHARSHTCLSFPDYMATLPILQWIHGIHKFPYLAGVEILQEIIIHDGSFYQLFWSEKYNLHKTSPSSALFVKMLECLPVRNFGSMENKMKIQVTYDSITRWQQ